MKHLSFLLLLLTLYYAEAKSQIDLQSESKKILTEGLKLYKLEKSAWIASDSTENKPKEEYITGFVSYFNKDNINVLFYKKISDDTYSVLYTFYFKNLTDVSYINYNNETRNPTDKELMYIQLKEGTFDLLENFDWLYAKQENTGKNISIYKEKGIYKIFVMTGSNEYGIIPLGKDLEFKCLEDQSVIELVCRLHQYYLPIDINDIKKDTKSTLHHHSDKSSQFITSTDICTFMLYKDMSNIKEHKVISADYVSVFNTQKLTLLIFKKSEYNIKFNTHY